MFSVFLVKMQRCRITNLLIVFGRNKLPRYVRRFLIQWSLEVTWCMSYFAILINSFRFIYVWIANSTNTWRHNATHNWIICCLALCFWIKYTSIISILLKTWTIQIHPSCMNETFEGWTQLQQCHKFKQHTYTSYPRASVETERPIRTWFIIKTNCIYAILYI